MLRQSTADEHNATQADLFARAIDRIRQQYSLKHPVCGIVDSGRDRELIWPAFPMPVTVYVTDLVSGEFHAVYFDDISRSRGAMM